MRRKRVLHLPSRGVRAVQSTATCGETQGEPFVQSSVFSLVDRRPVASTHSTVPRGTAELQRRPKPKCPSEGSRWSMDT